MGVKHLVELANATLGFRRMNWNSASAVLAGLEYLRMPPRFMPPPL